MSKIDDSLNKWQFLLLVLGSLSLVGIVGHFVSPGPIEQWWWQTLLVLCLVYLAYLLLTKWPDFRFARALLLIAYALGLGIACRLLFYPVTSLPIYLICTIVAGIGSILMIRDILEERYSLLRAGVYLTLLVPAVIIITQHI